MGKVLLVLVVLGAIGVGAYLWYNMDRRSDEQIAMEVTREWTVASVDNISNTVAGLVVAAVPGLSLMPGLQDNVAGVIGDQIRSRVTWNADWPRCSSSIKQCDVTVTARANIPIRIPLVIDKTATIAVPFNLEVDTGDQQVDDWDADISGASISGIEVGDVMSGAGDILGAAGSAVDSARQGIQDFLEDDDTQQALDDTRRAVEDAAGSAVDSARRGIQDFLDDDDTQQALDDTRRAVEDAADSARRGVEDFLDDDDTQQALDDTRKAVEDAFGGLFGGR